MHAASVYPEPGSNSLNMIYQGYISATIIPSLSALLTLKSSLFLNSKEFSESFIFSSLLFNFQGASLSAFCGQLCYYIKTVSLCQVLFSKFFEFFSKRFALLLQPFFLLSWLIRFSLQLSLTALLLYQLTSSLSTTFFNIFWLLLFIQAIQYD